MITIGMLKVLLTQTFCVVYNQSYSDTVPYKATLNDLHCTDYLMPGTKLMVQIPGRPRNWMVTVHTLCGIQDCPSLAHLLLMSSLWVTAVASSGSGCQNLQSDRVHVSPYRQALEFGGGCWATLDSDVADAEALSSSVNVIPNSSSIWVCQ